MTPTAAIPDLDLSCRYCLGTGEMCTLCEMSTGLCECAAPKVLFCGWCQGDGTDPEREP